MTVIVIVSFMRNKFQWRSLLKNTRKPTCTHQSHISHGRSLWYKPLDPLNMSHISTKSYQYVLIVSGKASRYLSECSIPSNEAEGGATCFLRLSCALGIAKETHGPANNPRGQEAAERRRTQLQSTLSELRKAKSNRWDKYVMPAP